MELPTLSIAHSHPIASYGEIDHLDYAFWMKTCQPWVSAAHMVELRSRSHWCSSPTLDWSALARD
jgi:hypothetical protein